MHTRLFLCFRVQAFPLSKETAAIADGSFFYLYHFSDLCLSLSVDYVVYVVINSLIKGYNGLVGIINSIVFVILDEHLESADDH